MLLDASDAFQSGSLASYGSARAITKTGMLLDAIWVCTDAGSREFDIHAINILNSQVKCHIMNRGAYATVALAAFKVGRQGVANLLLTLETSVVDKVPAALAAIGLHSDTAVVTADAK